MIEIAAIAALVTSFGVAISFAVFWHNRGKAEGEIKAQSAAADRVAAAAFAKADLVRSELTAYKLQAAKDHVALATAETRLTTEITGLREDFRQMRDEFKQVTKSFSDIALKLAAKALNQ